MNSTWAPIAVVVMIIIPTGLALLLGRRRGAVAALTYAVVVSVLSSYGGEVSTKAGLGIVCSVVVSSLLNACGALQDALVQQLLLLTVYAVVGLECVYR